MALEVAGKEEVGAEGGDVLGQITNGDVEVPARGAWGQPQEVDKQTGSGQSTGAQRKRLRSAHLLISKACDRQVSRLR